jgi:outer membrane lipoprotein-sorting protein
MQHMKQFTIALCALVMTAAPAMAERLPLSAISRYLNSLQTAEAPFTQITEDGTISTGKLYIKRPGRVRFEYDPPEEAIVVAGGGAVVIHDPKSNTIAETYPLKRTPLSIILERTVDLARANMVTGHAFDGTATVVTAQDPENPGYGSIQLMFTGDPVELRKWVITDSSGSQTTIVLRDMTTGHSLRDSLFNTRIVEPVQR